MSRGRAVRLNRAYWPDQSQTPEEASALQLRWAKQVVEEPLPEPPALIAGCDVHLRGDLGRATIVVMRFPELDVVETVHGEATTAFPYIPGFLGFREVPVLLEAWGRLVDPPDLVLVDGHGIAHPRGLGIAAHLGVVLDVPTIGVAKSPLVGKPEGALGEEPGSEAPLVWKGDRIGTLLRTRRRSNPLYVSIGHRVSLGGAVEWVRRTGTGYRLPEPTRQAHLAANATRRGE